MLNIRLHKLFRDTSPQQEAFKYIGEAGSLDISSDLNVANLKEEARKLKKVCNAFSDAREYGVGADDSPLSGEEAMRLLEEGSNLLKSVVRTANAVKAAISFERSKRK